MNLLLSIFKNKDGTYTSNFDKLNITSEGNSLNEIISNSNNALECHIEGLKKDNIDFKDYNIDIKFENFDKPNKIEGIELKEISSNELSKKTG